MSDRLRQLKKGASIFYLSWFVSSLSWLILPACNTSQQKPVTIGSKPFQFDPRKVVELEIAKSDPASGDRWHTVLQRSQKNWFIRTPPDGQTLLDLRANESFIAHLIDTLKELKIAAIAPQGPLESFGLAPPRFAVKWKTADHEMTFRVGTKLKDGKGEYFTLDGEKVFVASGMAIRMLDLIESFQFLRNHTWAAIKSDDVDEIELKKSGKFFLYAQREGDRWTDQKHQQLHQDIHHFLEKLTTSETEDFIETESQAKPLMKELMKGNTLYEARLIDRAGKSTHLKIQKKGSSVYGFSSARPSVIFKLNPRTISWFDL